MIRTIALLFVSVYVFTNANAVVSDFGSITFSNVKAYGFTVSFNSSVNDADGFVCLRSLQEIDESFLIQNFGAFNQTVPGRGSGVGHAKVFQSAAPAFFNVREVVEATDYYFAIVPYRLNGSLATFIPDSSILAQVRSATANYGSYYTGLDFNASDILTQLTSLLQSHTMMDYIAYKNTAVPVIFERDTAGQQKVVNCEYSGETKIYTGSFDFVALDYSREHMLARSWMPTGGATTSPEGSDYHNLALTNLGSVNALRSNYPFGEVVQVSSSYLECKLGKDSNLQDVFEPREEKKGDIARAIFYELICYNGLSGSWGFNHLSSYGTEQEVSILLNWHFNDLPDAFEKAKHEYVYSLQNNRNPFIDFPDLANCIDFAEIIKNATCPAVGVENVEPHAITVFPNPASDIVFIQSENPGEIKQVEVINLNGKVLATYLRSSLEHRIAINLSSVPSGFLIVRTTMKNGTIARNTILHGE